MNEIKHIGFDIVEFKGQKVELDILSGFDNTPHQHELEVIHHIDENGLHYCPTMFIWCIVCGAIGDEPEPYECNKVGVK